MRLLAGLTALAVLTFAAGQERSAEPPHFLFAQGLRDKQMPDLALQYLESLKSKKLAPQVAATLPLELAKSRLSLAVLETDPGRRTALQDQARGELQAFVRDQPKHVLAADANLELARVAVLQGKSQLTRARRAEGQELRRVELRKARSLFEQAATQLEAAAKEINGKLAEYAEPKSAEEIAAKRTLTRSKLQAEFEQGMNLFDQAQTYVEESELLVRGQVMKKAIATLEKVSRRETKNPTCALARVWLGRAHFDNDTPNEASRVYNEVIAESGEHNETARRLGRWFRLQLVAKDATKKDAPAQVQKAAESWLADYRNYQNTPEGYGVRFELAESLLNQAVPIAKSQPSKARDLYARAQKLYQALEVAENDFSEAAREKKLNIVLTLSEERSKGDIAKLRDFEECHLRAQFELAKLNRAEKELKADKLDKQRDDHLRNIIQALNRGLDLADAKVAVQDLGDARYLLTRAYYTTEDYYRTAVLGEHLARILPQSPRAPQAGTYALYAYAQLIGAQERASAGPETLDADRSRLRKLAEYMEKTWPTDPAADVARHQLGTVLWSEKKYPQAVAALGRITSSYPNTTHSLYLLALAAMQADSAGIASPKGKPTYQQFAVAALQAVPEPTAGTAATTTQTWLEAKLQLGGLLYTAKNFAALQALADTLQKKLAGPDLALDESTVKELRPRVKALELLARFGQGEADYRAGSYAKVRGALEPIVNQLRNPATRGELTDIKHPGLLHGLLGLALRANVQDNKTDRAKDVLDLLQATAPENALDLLRDLVRQLSAQIQELRQKGDAAKAQLDQTVNSFSIFLDVLAKQQEAAKTPRYELVLFLADSYASLDNHGKAAQLLRQIPEPQPEGESKVADPKKLQVYRAARILYVRELRLSKQFNDAKAELDHILGTPEKPRWGQLYLDVKKEQIFLQEDQGKFPSAAKEWSRLMTTMQKQIKQDAKVREQYYECYFHLAHCLYKYGLSLGDPARRRKQIGQAANWIIQLEKTQPDFGGEASRRRFDDLLQRETVLREVYDEQKKAGK